MAIERFSEQPIEFTFHNYLPVEQFQSLFDPIILNGNIEEARRFLHTQNVSGDIFNLIDSWNTPYLLLLRGEVEKLDLLFEWGLPSSVHPDAAMTLLSLLGLAVLEKNEVMIETVLKQIQAEGDAPPSPDEPFVVSDNSNSLSEQDFFDGLTVCDPQNPEHTLKRYTPFQFDSESFRYLVGQAEKSDDITLLHTYQLAKIYNSSPEILDLFKQHGQAHGDIWAGDTCFSTKLIGR